MVIKRPLEEEKFLEPSFKQPKHHDYIKELTLNTKESQVTSLRVDSAGEDGWFEDGDTDSASVADKELEASAPLSLVTSSSTEEDAENGDVFFWSYRPGYNAVGIPRQPHEQFDDPYVYLLNCSPRKEVPIGPDYQAELPPWDPNTGGKDFSGSKYFADNKREQKLMGNCIIPLPDLNDSAIDGIKVGQGRTDCCCLDVGSMRCVLQHINEAREKLRETIGEDNFLELGFCDMGDEMVCKWTPDDEQVFHEVVFSNPLTEGRKFWNHLGAAFPTRTKKELVSYYFNVFMLRRRAVQNRSYLEINSDDDEDPNVANRDVYLNGSCSLELDTGNDDDWRGPNKEWYLVGGEGGDSTIESFDNQDLDSSWMDDFWSEPAHVGGGEGCDENHDTCGNVEQQDGTQIDDRTEGLSGQETKNLHDDNINFDS